MDFSKIHEHAKTHDLTVVKRGLMDYDMLRGMKEYLENLGEKVVYLPTNRTLPDIKDIERLALATQLAESREPFFDYFDMDIDISHIAECGSGYTSLFRIYTELAYISPDTIILIDEPGHGLHALWKEQIVVAIKHFFPAKHLIASTWFEQVTANVHKECVLS